MLQELQFILFLLVCGHDGSERFSVSAHEFAAFADFLRWQQLPHAIIVTSDSSDDTNTALLQDVAALRDFRLRFHNAGVARSNFTVSSCFYDVARVGIYLAPLEDVVLQQQLLHAAASTAGDVFNNTIAWFVLSAASNTVEALQNARRFMTQLPLNVSADITLAVWENNSSGMQLFDIYKIQSQRLEVKAKGYWHPKQGLQMNQSFLQSFVRLRSNLQGLILRGGTALTEKPANIGEIAYMENNQEYKKLDAMQRKTFQLMKIMESMHNLSFQVIFYPLWGSRSPNGSWSGMIADLLSHDLELTLCPLRLVASRVHVVQFSLEVHVEYIYFILRHPRRNIIRNIFLQPFVDAVWYSIVGVIAVAVLALFMHLQHEYRLRLTGIHAERSLDYVALTVLEAIFLQGPTPSVFSATSTRLLMICICLFSVLLMQFYSAFIVGSLLSVSPRTITSLEALYNSSFEIGMENIPYNFDIFTNLTNPVASAIYTQRICKDRQRHILPIEQGAEGIKRGGFAFHVSANRIYFILKQLLSEAEFCDLQEIALNPPYQTPIALRRNSPFREYVAQTVLLLRTSGLLKYNEKQWQIPKLDCGLSQGKEVEVDLQHFLPALILLSSAMLFSIAVLLLEFLFDAVQRKWQFAKISKRYWRRSLQRRGNEGTE